MPHLKWFVFIKTIAMTSTDSALQQRQPRGVGAAPLHSTAVFAAVSINLVKTMPLRYRGAFPLLQWGFLCFHDISHSWRCNSNMIHIHDHPAARK